MVLEKVVTIIAAQFSVDEDQLNEDTTFEELGADELDIAELALAIESEFEIELDEEDVDRMTDISDLVKIIKANISLAD